MIDYSQAVGDDSGGVRKPGAWRAAFCSLCVFFFFSAPVPSPRPVRSLCGIGSVATAVVPALWDWMPVCECRAFMDGFDLPGVSRASRQWIATSGPGDDGLLGLVFWQRSVFC